jgi:branched-chain amino acid transport system substrate-binding protein
VNDEKVFALFNVVGTKNNLGARDFINTNCVPNVLIASGAVQWGNQKFPWMLGSELVPYPLEMHTFVEYLKKNKPSAKIAVLAANDDFGQTYTESLKALIKGTKLTITKVQTYDPEGADVKAQVTDLASSGADAFVLGAALLACPAALTAAADAGWKPITYMSGTCVSKILLGAAGQAADKLFSVTPLLDPADTRNDTDPAMVLYKEQVKKYAPDADTTDGIVAYGWTTGAMLVKILESSPKLDRVSVMNAARTLKDVKGVGLELPTSSWNTSKDDWFIGEAFQLIQYDATAKHTNPVGDPIDLDGKTAEFAPESLLNS